MNFIRRYAGELGMFPIKSKYLLMTLGTLVLINSACGKGTQKTLTLKKGTVKTETKARTTIKPVEAPVVAAENPPTAAPPVVIDLIFKDLSLSINGGTLALANYVYSFNYPVPEGQKVEGQWEFVSGPLPSSKVVFSSPVTLKTTMKFSDFGNYEVRFSETSGKKNRLLITITNPGLNLATSQFLGMPPIGNSNEFKIAAPAEKIIIIYNYLSDDQTISDPCLPNALTIEGVIPQIRALANKKIKNKTVLVFDYCSPDSRGAINDDRVVVEYKSSKQAVSLNILLDLIQSQGVAANQVFLAGWGGGAWAALKTAESNRFKFNSVIGFAPSFVGELRRRDPLVQNVMNTQAQALGQIKQLDGLVFAADLDIYETPTTLSFLSKVPGIKLQSYNLTNSTCDERIDWHAAYFDACMTGLNADVEKFIAEKTLP
ncbi:MAG: hypothetical protein NTX25_19550 [Proteobacteria bacterium]|nr:hypothetical protein [Pseudomonadota bacterium]